jgi:hypothetical protein
MRLEKFCRQSTTESFESIIEGGLAGVGNN